MICRRPTKQQESFEQLVVMASKHKWSAAYCNKVQRFIQSEDNKDFIKNSGTRCLRELASNMAPPKLLQWFLDNVSIKPKDLGYSLFLIIEKHHNVRDNTHHKQYLELFLQKGASLDFKCNNWECVFSYVLKRGDLECIKLLFEKNPLLLTSKNQYNQSCVDYLTRTGNLNCIKFLLEQGYLLLVDKEGGGKSLIDRKKKSRVDDIVVKHNPECIKFLLEQNCLSLDHKDLYGRSLVDCLVSTGKLDYIKFLLTAKRITLDYKDKDKQSILHYAVKANKADTVQYLIKEAPSSLLNSQDCWGHTPLALAAKRGATEMRKLLCEAKWDHTPLTFAAERGTTEIITLLCEANADPNIQDQKGQTPLYFLLTECYSDSVSFREHRQQIELMLKYGATLNVVDIWGNTPLHHAVSCYTSRQRTIDLLSTLNITPIPQLLLQKVSNVKSYIDRQNNEGDTALHIALRDGKKSLVELLLNYNPSCDISNEADELPLDVAINVYQQKSKNIDYLNIIRRILSSMCLSEDRISESLEQIEIPALREFLHSSIKSGSKSARADGPVKKEEEGKAVKAEAKKEEVIEDVISNTPNVEPAKKVDLTVEWFPLTYWQATLQKIVTPSMASGSPLLKQHKMPLLSCWHSENNENHKPFLGDTARVNEYAFPTYEELLAEVD